MLEKSPYSHSIYNTFLQASVYIHNAQECLGRGKGVREITANAYSQIKTFDLMFIVSMYFVTFSKCLPSTKAFFIHMKTKTDTASIKSMFAVSDPGKGNKLKI